MQIRNYLPKTLFWRSFLILVIPVIILHALTTYFFYQRHWQSLQRNLSSNLASEINLLTNLGGSLSFEEVQKYSSKYLYIDVKTKRDEEYYNALIEISDEFEVFSRELKKQIQTNFLLYETADAENIIILLEKGYYLHFETSAKRLSNPTTYIFALWISGFSALLIIIATLFLRNQIRPMTSLAQAAENFGKGKSDEDFKISGAREVRVAAIEFHKMKERIRRQISSRMQMLSGISHDLRTPLTRMKLELEMLKDKNLKKDLAEEIAAMEHMISEYLSFAKGINEKEKLKKTNLKTYFESLLKKYKNFADINFEKEKKEKIEINIQQKSFTRALENILSNAKRYADSAQISFLKRSDYLKIYIEDDGPGIKSEMREEVFKPFMRLEESRNIDTGGVGLGLSIARDIVHAHGGEIILDESKKLGGLKVIIKLPA